MYVWQVNKYLCMHQCVQLATYECIHVCMYVPVGHAKAWLHAGVHACIVKNVTECHENLV